MAVSLFFVVENTRVLEKATDLPQVTDKLDHIMINVALTTPCHEQDFNSQL
jgi:hypothetical protein